jgi:hypothetical protein
MLAWSTLRFIFALGLQGTTKLSRGIPVGIVVPSDQARKTKHQCMRASALKTGL